jgi:diaminohydroxyphosphoribosylaminopyrimidine deaminase/5-amino-6-(5-phosphoribosylamino)uracil reductase
MNNVSPNPRVGAVVVCDDKIIGEGFHRAYGEPHAEVNAISHCTYDEPGAKNILNRSTIYVNLEPCSHYGKTPPCTDLIIKHNIRRVVISCLDPNPRINGVAKLLEAGIEVVTGVLENEGRWLNRRFFTRITKHRPYIFLKWAQSTDGFIAPSATSRDFRLTCEETRVEDHIFRANEDAIIVGTNTLLLDNPQLNKRLCPDKGKNPLRISFDFNERLPLSLNFFDGSQPSLLFVSSNSTKKYPFADIKKIDLQKPVLPQITSLNINSLIVEGGAALLNSFIKENLWDEVYTYTAPIELHSGLKAPSVPLDTILYSEHLSGKDIIRKYRRM